MKDTVAALKKRLWRYVSLYIRLKYSDENGEVQCFTCPTKKHYKEMHAGHYKEKSVSGIPLYFEEKNIHPQCPRCNMYLSGNLSVYALKLIEKYGDGILHELEGMKHKLLPQPKDWLKEQIEIYKKKVKELKDEKGIS